MAVSYEDPIEVGFASEGAAGKVSGRPSSFKWRGREHRIVRVLRQWYDAGGLPRRRDFGGRQAPFFGGAARRAGRDWYRVLTESGEIFEIYHDRRPGGKKEDAWILGKKLGDLQEGEEKGK